MLLFTTALALRDLRDVRALDSPWLEDGYKLNFCESEGKGSSSEATSPSSGGFLGALFSRVLIVYAR